jgi:hypothetical protein
MDKKKKDKVLKEIGLALPWYNDIFSESVLDEIIKNPKITKKELAWIKVKGLDTKKLISIDNEHIAQKFINIVKMEVKR